MNTIIATTLGWPDAAILLGFLASAVIILAMLLNYAFTKSADETFPTENEEKDDPLFSTWSVKNTYTFNREELERILREMQEEDAAAKKRLDEMIPGKTEAAQALREALKETQAERAREKEEEIQNENGDFADGLVEDLNNSFKEEEIKREVDSQ